MATVNLILYRSPLWVLQINYSLNAFLKFFPHPALRCTPEVTTGKVPSLTDGKLMPVECSAHELEEFLIWLMEIFVQFIEQFRIYLGVRPTFGLV